jgi:hypothetical protein
MKAATGNADPNVLRDKLKELGVENPAHIEKLVNALYEEPTAGQPAGLASWQMGPTAGQAAVSAQGIPPQANTSFLKEKPSITFGSNTTERVYDPTHDHIKGEGGHEGKNWGGLVARPPTAAHSTICRGFNKDDCGKTKGSIGCEWDAWKEWNGKDGCVPIVTSQPMKSGDGTSPHLMGAEQLILSVWGEAIKRGGEAGPKIVSVDTLKQSITHHNIDRDLLPQIAETLDEIILNIETKGVHGLPKSSVKLKRERHLRNLRDLKSWLESILQ